MCLEGRGSSRDPDQQETYDRFRVKSTGQWRVVLTRQDKFETQVHQSPCESDNRKEDEEAKVCDAKQTDTYVCCAVCPGCTQTKCQCLCPDPEPKVQSLSTGRGRTARRANKRKAIPDDPPTSRYNFAKLNRTFLFHNTGLPSKLLDRPIVIRGQKRWKRTRNCQ